MARQRLACDRCHVLKEKCISSSNTAASPCARCSRLGAQCATSRRKNEVGRPRKPETASTRPQAGTEFVWLPCGLQSQGRNLAPALTPRPTSKSRPRIKPKTKPKELRGTKPSALQAMPETTPSLFLQRPSHPVLLFAAGSPENLALTPYESLLLHDYLTNRRMLARFLLCASFTDAVLSHLTTTLHASPSTLLHVSLACATRLRLRQSHQPTTVTTTTTHTNEHEAGYLHSAQAVRILRSMGQQHPKPQPEIQVLALTLGLGLVTFDVLEGGRWAHEVCRFTLSLVERLGGEEDHDRDGVWVHTMGKRGGLDEGLVPLVWMDVWNCLARREVPVCKLVGWGDGVDRYIGRCWGLLGMVFEVCLVGWRMGRGERGGEVMGKLRVVEEMVRRWETRGTGQVAPPDMEGVIEAQARIYKTATLLVIHRLRYGLGTQDEEARRMAQTILEEIKAVYLDCDGKAQESKADYRLGLPLFMAGMEGEDHGERIRVLDLVPRVVCEEIYPDVCEGLRQALIFAWEACDGPSHLHWFNLSPASMPPFVLF
ncbi:hypothetical protein C8A05DRAFT_16939 [Staphylotrichum tortipilum]|uniref:Zn(2)-C6 fungal-type domain-containing protein n=1 Tax=Staphylotrichum tortipilum TaxID=2831512 RepID=A0AAN6MIE4_9PEZI|nr:hypothetical protein C8A05DRAFT_16939 [Staphylotrichum longicolle]